MLNRQIAIVAVAVIATVAFFSFKSGDDRNFQIAKNLDIFNAIVKELDMFYVDTIDPNKTIREGIDNMLYTLDPYTEYFPEEEIIHMDLPYTVEKEDDIFVVEGPKIEKMLGYTNLDSEKGFAFFQKFLKETGILEQLENAGVQEGDTIRMYGLQFEYYR